MSGPGSVGPPQGSLPPPPYPGFSPSHSPASAPGSVGAPHPPQSPQFYPPKPSPSSGSSLLASQLHQPPTNPHLSLNTDQDEKQRLRFQIELEFVQNLGNPNYLNFLAQRGFFKDPTFVNYLKYLQYWKEPQYVKFLKYPVCLHFLEMLQHEAFRKEIVNGLVRDIYDVAKSPVVLSLFCLLFSVQSSSTTRRFCSGSIIRGNEQNSWRTRARRTRRQCPTPRPRMLVEEVRQLPRLEQPRSRVKRTKTKCRGTLSAWANVRQTKL